MAEGNLERVQTAWEQFLSTGEIPRHLIHDDVEVHWSQDIPDTRIYHGPEGLAKALTEWQESWEETEYEFFETREAGDHVLLGFRETGHGRSGIKVEKEWFQIYSFRDGKLAMLREFTDRAEALEAAGLPE